MVKTRRYALAISLALVLTGAVPFIACVGDSPGTNCVAGGEGCACNVGKCLSGLTCVSGVCVALGDGATSDANVGNDAGGDTGLILDGGAAPPTTCKEYCTLMMNACTGGNGQYSSQPTCEAMCTKFPAGVNGAQTGNSFACRAYHASLAALGGGNATLHCPHAGPFGFGACGTEAENFCALYLGFCAGDGGGYGSLQSCAAAFDAVTDTTDGGSFLNGTGPRDCREYHLENAYSSGDTSSPHCAHSSKAGGGVCP